MIKKFCVVLCALLFTHANAEPLESKSSEIVKIDIVSDVVCPWCAIGYKRLETAIDELGMSDKVQIEWHPFQLNPYMVEEGINADEYLKRKMRLSEQGLRMTRTRVANTAKESGLEFNYHDDMRKPNTFYSHVLLDYAKEHGKQTELKTRLQQAYFTEKKNIGLLPVLKNELIAVGLDADEALERLQDEKAVKRVKGQEEYWKSRGVSSIPTMVFNDAGVLKGAQSVDTYKRVLQYLSKRSE